MNGISLLSQLVRSQKSARLISLMVSCRQCSFLGLARDRLLPHVNDVRNVNAFHIGASSCQEQAASTSIGRFLSKLKFDFGFISGLKYSKTVFNLSGFHMLVCCTEMVDTKQFFTEFNMPDTFNSWFLITTLHVWLCMARLVSLGKDGRVLRNCLVKTMWEDVDGRSKNLGNAGSTFVRKESMQQMGEVFLASIFAYDEGLLGDDKELAAALWRIFFEMSQDVEPGHLELMVSYVRKQIAHLDSQDEVTILRRGVVTFLPLRGDKLDDDTSRRQLRALTMLRAKV